MSGVLNRRERAIDKYADLLGARLHALGLWCADLRAVARRCLKGRADGAGCCFFCLGHGRLGANPGARSSGREDDAKAEAVVTAGP